MQRAPALASPRRRLNRSRADERAGRIGEMSLRILNQKGARTEADLLRLFQQTEARLAEHLAEATPLEVGTAYSNRELADVYFANHVRDIALPDGMIPAQAYESVQQHFAGCGTRCASWAMNVAAPQLQTRPMAEYLMRQGYAAQVEDVMLLGQTPPIHVPQIEGLKVIPARASFKHVRELFAGSDLGRRTPNAVEAAVMHLDDPHWDALLALRDGKAAGYVGVLAMGEVGRIEQLHVAEDQRRKGLGLLMMTRALEICARSLFKQVMLSVRPGNSDAKALYSKLGFGLIGQMTGYFAPWTGL
jgi:ribosomal protein S18 acetylase RimI-like enzyme